MRLYTTSLPAGAFQYQVEPPQVRFGWPPRSLARYIYPGPLIREWSLVILVTLTAFPYRDYRLSRAGLSQARGGSISSLQSRLSTTPRKERLPRLDHRPPAGKGPPKGAQK